MATTTVIDLREHHDGPQHGSSTTVDSRPDATLRPVRPETIRRTFSGIATVGALAGAASTFLPWVKSGRVARNGMDVARSAKRLGLLDDTAGSAIAAAWFLVPLVAALALTAWALGRDRIVMTAAAYCGVVIAAASQAVSRGPLPLDVGPRVAMVVSVVTLVACAAAAVAPNLVNRSTQKALKTRASGHNPENFQDSSAPVSSAPTRGDVSAP